MATETTERLFEIPDTNWSEFESRIAKLQRRAAKLQSASISFEVVERYFDFSHTVRNQIKSGHVTREQATAQCRLYEWRKVRVTGEAPVLPGFYFLASIEPSDAGNLILGLGGKVTEQEFAQLVEAHQHKPIGCDHCKLARDRAKSYLVRAQGTGEVFEIGRTCLRDFLGHKNPEAIAAWCEIFALGLSSLSELEEEREGGSGRSSHLPLDWYLGWVAASIRTNGWIPRSAPGLSTADDAICCACGYAPYGHCKDPLPRYSVEESDKATARAATEWAANLAHNGNDFLYNLSVLAQNEVIPERRIGLAAAIVSAYLREQGQIAERERKAAAQPSAWVGEIGKRQIFTLTLVKLIVIDKEFSQFGPTYLHKFVDQAGNDISWFASNPDFVRDSGGRGRTLSEGETVQLKGTVKKHDTYQGRNQTVLSRCAFLAMVDGKQLQLTEEE